MDSSNPVNGCVYTGVTCNDSNACTADSCDPVTGCANTDISASCDDSNACTVDACDPGTGCSSTAISCNDGNLCTADSCDPVDGCEFTDTSAMCDDANACTADSCSATSGCVNTPIPGASCVCPCWPGGVDQWWQDNLPSTCDGLGGFDECIVFPFQGDPAITSRIANARCGDPDLLLTTSLDVLSFNG